MFNNIFFEHPLLMTLIFIAFIIASAMVPIPQDKPFKKGLHFFFRLLLLVCLIWPLPLLTFMGIIAGEHKAVEINSSFVFFLSFLLPPILSILLTIASVYFIFIFPSRHKEKRVPFQTHTKEKQKNSLLPLPLWETVLQNNKENLQNALSKGADVNAPYPANGNTPLHIATWNGYTEITQLLLAQPGINKEAKNLAGKTPLDLAKEQNREEIIKLLEK